MKPTYFGSSDEFHRWLATHHATARELLVGFHKRASGRPSLTWPESVDDGIRRRVDDQRYSIRFTPRRPGSIWSVVNTKRVAALMRAGRMHDAGLKVFRERDARKTRQYSFEREAARLPPPFERQFRANVAAWACFGAAAPSYRKVATHWVVSAKQAATRERRLATLIASSARGEKIDWMRPGKKSNDRHN